LTLVGRYFNLKYHLFYFSPVLNHTDSEDTSAPTGLANIACVFSDYQQPVHSVRQTGVGWQRVLPIIRSPFFLLRTAVQTPVKTADLSKGSFLLLWGWRRKRFAIIAVESDGLCIPRLFHSFL
jgi:hypothetical protein